MNSNTFKYTEDGITFNSVKSPQTLFKSGPLGIEGRLNINGENVDDIDYDKPFINAVDIDWNGVTLSGLLIDTTADLIKWLKGKTDATTTFGTEISYQISCYRWYISGHTPMTPIESDETPDAAESDSSSYTEPSTYWEKFAPNRPGEGNWTLWQCTGTKFIYSNGTTPTISWNNSPFSITGERGEKGDAGADLADKEWIYCSIDHKLTSGELSSAIYNPSRWSANQNSNYRLYPNYWDNHPSGVSETVPYEYASYRTKTNGSWGRYSEPILWSHYGKNGMDGDGVEYVFIRTTKNTPTPWIAENIYNTNNKDKDEFRPIVTVNGTNVLDNNTGPLDLVAGANSSFCSDNPKGVSFLWKYEWVLKRKKQNGSWEDFSDPAIWSNWAEGGTVYVNDLGMLVVDGEETNINVDSGGESGVIVKTVDSLPSSGEPGELVLCDGFLYIYNSGWVNLGEYTGAGKYAHVAFADEIVKNQLGYVTKIKNFRVTKDDNLPIWMGICVNDTKNDPGFLLNDALAGCDPGEILGGKVGTFEGSELTIALELFNSLVLSEVNNYEWNFIIGKDTGKIEYVYILGKKEYLPNIDESDVDYKGRSSSDSEYLPKLKVLDGDVDITNSAKDNFLGREDNGNVYWMDDPTLKANRDYPKYYMARRQNVNGKWGEFQIVENPQDYIEEFVYTEYKIVPNKTTIVAVDEEINTDLTFKLFTKQSNETDWIEYPEDIFLIILYKYGEKYKALYYDPSHSKSNPFTYTLNGNLEENSTIVVYINTSDNYSFGGNSVSLGLNAEPIALEVIDEFLISEVVVNSAICEINVSKYFGVKDPNIIYHINCSPNNVLFRYSAAGDIITTDIPIMCSVVKRESGKEAYIMSVPDTNNHIILDDLHIYCKYNTETAWLEYLCDAANGTRVLYSDITDNTKNALEFVLSTVDDPNNVGDTNIIYRTTVPVGMEGRKGIHQVVLNLYRKSETVLTNDDLPLDGLICEFYTNNFINPNSTNENKLNYWSTNRAISGRGDLYLITTTVSSFDNYVTIDQEQWGTPFKVNDFDVILHFTLYAEGNERPNLPTNVLYNPLNGSLVLPPGSIWSKNMPSVLVNNAKYWHTTTTIKYRTEDSGPIDCNNWSTPESFVYIPPIGKLFYPMGEFNDVVNYSTYYDDLRVPLVLYNGKYYYLDNIIELSYNVSGNPHQSDPEHDNVHWKEATNYELIITDGIFAKFAKLGSGIMIGDYLLSLNGKIDGNTQTMYTIPYEDNGTMIYTYGNPPLPAYLYFENYINNSAFPKFIPNWYVNYKTGEMWAAGGNFVVANDGSVKVGYTGTEGKYSFEVTNDGEIIAADGNFIIDGDSLKIGYNKEKDKYSFEVNRDGSITAANGNFIINEDGSITAAGGKFVIDKDGTLVQKGVITEDNTITIDENNFNDYFIYNPHINGPEWRGSAYLIKSNWYIPEKFIFNYFPDLNGYSLLFIGFANPAFINKRLCLENNTSNIIYIPDVKNSDVEFGLSAQNTILLYCIPDKKDYNSYYEGRWVVLQSY